MRSWTTSVTSSCAIWIHHSWGSLMTIQMNAAMPTARAALTRRGSQRVRIASMVSKKYSNVLGNTSSNQRSPVASNRVAPTRR